MRAASCKPAKGRSRPSPGKGEAPAIGAGEGLFLFKRERRRDEARGGLARGANGSRSASAVSACKGIRLSVTLLLLACPAPNQELFLSLSKKILKVALFPKRETLGHLSSQGSEASRSFERPSSSIEN